MAYLDLFAAPMTWRERFRAPPPPNLSPVEAYADALRDATLRLEAVAATLIVQLTATDGGDLIHLNGDRPRRAI